MTLDEFLGDKKHGTAAFAKLVNTSRMTMHRIRTGARIPRPDLMKAIIEATGGKVVEADFYRAAEARKLADEAKANPQTA